jgi:DNA-binding GntR family transcriptional regulator
MYEAHRVAHPNPASRIAQTADRAEQHSMIVRQLGEESSVCRTRRGRESYDSRMPPVLPAPVDLRRVSTVEALAGALREQVLSGALPAGTPLREAELCKAYGVSRHSVRTALQALVPEGLVRIEPNRGAMVPTISIDDIEDLYAFRAVLEIAAARTIVAEREGLAPVEAALGNLQDVPNGTAWGAVRDADLAFHQALVDAAGSPRMSQTFRALLSEVRLGLTQIRVEFEDHAAIVRQHAQILRALRRADPDLATALLIDHFDEAKTVLRAQYGSSTT